MHDADAAALNSKPADVLQYAVAVCEEIITWLDTINDDDLFLVPDGPANLSQCTAYQGFEISDEIDGLYARSVHDLLASTCYGHIRSHFGEIETIVKQCRRR